MAYYNTHNSANFKNRTIFAELPPQVAFDQLLANEVDWQTTDPTKQWRLVSENGNLNWYYGTTLVWSIPATPQ